MKNLTAKFAILLVIILMLPASYFGASQKTKNSTIKLSAKIVDRQKADITIYLEQDSQKKYLNLDASEAGFWETKMDVDLKKIDINFAKFYKHPIYDGYIYRILKRTEFKNVSYHKNVLAAVTEKNSNI